MVLNADRGKEQVSVSLTHKSGKLRLIVADDGVGLSEKFDINKSGGLGPLPTDAAGGAIFFVNHWIIFLGIVYYNLSRVKVAPKLLYSARFFYRMSNIKLIVL